MSEFLGKTAIISGGAEGIGLSIARALGKRGMNIVIGDIDAEQMAKAEQALSEEGVNVLCVKLDVSKIELWEALVEQASARFGNIHMLVNNAGVGGTPGTVEQASQKDWEWVVDVNLLGVVYGAKVVVPHIKQHGEGGWVINTASMAGMGGVPLAQAYTGTKVAVVGMSESWYQELKPHNIHVSVLCPAFVKTRIHQSYRNRQSEYGKAEFSDLDETQLAIAKHMQKVVENGIDVDLVGERVVEAIQLGELYIFTHPNYRKVLQRRAKAIDDAFARAAQSPLLQDLLDLPVDDFS